jgi:hypothetical protein
MSMATKCQTPGAQYASRIGGKKVSLCIELPFEMNLTLTEAVDLEKRLHNAAEMVLAPLFILGKKR